MLRTRLSEVKKIFWITSVLRLARAAAGGGASASSGFLMVTGISFTGSFGVGLATASSPFVSFTGDGDTATFSAGLFGAGTGLLTMATGLSSTGAGGGAFTNIFSLGLLGRGFEFSTRLGF